MTKADRKSLIEQYIAVHPAVSSESDHLRATKGAYIERLKKLVLEERKTEWARVQRLWSMPIPERVASAYCIEGLEILDSTRSGEILLSCPSNRSRFREGDILALNRGDPRTQPNILVTLDEDRDDQLLVSPYWQDVPWTELMEEESGWFLDVGVMDLSSIVLDALDEVADTITVTRLKHGQPTTSCQAENRR